MFPFRFLKGLFTLYQFFNCFFNFTHMVNIMCFCKNIILKIAIHK